MHTYQTADYVHLDCHIILKKYHFITLSAEMKVATLKRNSAQQALSLNYCNGDDHKMPSSKFLSCTHGYVKRYSPTISKGKCKGKGHAHNRPQGPKGVPGRLRPRIFLTFGTTRVVGRQPHAPAAFTPRGILWYSFLEGESTPGHMAPSVATEKFPNVTPPGIDPETVRLVAQCLNHYATPGPTYYQ
jgi:hypothetical protein